MGNFICGNQEPLNPGAQGKIPGILQRGPFANMRNRNQQHDGSLRPPHVMHRQRHRHGGHGRPLKLQQFANQMRVGAPQTRKRSQSWDTSHQQFSTRSFGKVCRDYQEKGVTKQQNQTNNNISFKENEQIVAKSFKNTRPKRSTTQKKERPNSRSFAKIDSMSTEAKLPSLKPKKESSFFIARKLRSLGGFGGGDDNEQFFDCLGDESKDDGKSAGYFTNNNKQNSNGELTFMPRTASKKENDGGLTFSDSEVEVEEEEESYYGGGRIFCIRRGFRWPRRAKEVLSEEHKDDVVVEDTGKKNKDLDKNNRVKYSGSDDELNNLIEGDDDDQFSADSDDILFTRQRAHSECFECTGMCKPQLLDELIEKDLVEDQLAAYVDNNNIIKEEETQIRANSQETDDPATAATAATAAENKQVVINHEDDNENVNKIENKQEEEETQHQENQKVEEPQPQINTQQEQEYEKADEEELIDHY